MNNSMIDLAKSIGRAGVTIPKINIHVKAENLTGHEEPGAEDHLLTLADLEIDDGPIGTHGLEGLDFDGVEAADTYLNVPDMHSIKAIPTPGIWKIAANPDATTISVNLSGHCMHELNDVIHWLYSAKAGALAVISTTRGTMFCFDYLALADAIEQSEATVIFNPGQSLDLFALVCALAADKVNAPLGVMCETKTHTAKGPWAMASSQLEGGQKQLGIVVGLLKDGGLLTEEQASQVLKNSKPIYLAPSVVQK